MSKTRPPRPPKGQTERERYCLIKATNLQEVLETCNRHITNIGKTQMDMIEEEDETESDRFYCDMFRKTWQDMRDDIQAIIDKEPAPNVKPSLIPQDTNGEFVPRFSGVGKQKLDELKKDYVITGYSFEQKPDAREFIPELKRGFITHGGLVGWWQPEGSKPMPAGKTVTMADIVNQPQPGYVYVVEATEMDFGQRPEGYYSFVDEESARAFIARMSKNGTAEAYVRYTWIGRRKCTAAFMQRMAALSSTQWAHFDKLDDLIV